MAMSLELRVKRHRKWNRKEGRPSARLDVGAVCSFTEESAYTNPSLGFTGP